MSRNVSVGFLYVCIYILLQEEQAWGCNLTSVNFHTTLEWQMEESDCDIQLYNGFNWNSISEVPVCKDGSCKVNLSWQTLDIYNTYQAKVQCPPGSMRLTCTTPTLQPYKDVIPGPPLLNVSLEDGKLHMCVSLPLAPGITPNSPPQPIQSIKRKLQDLILTVTTGKHTYCNELIKLTNESHCMDCKDLLPDAEYCATADFYYYPENSATKCFISRDLHRQTFAVKVASLIVISVIVFLLWISKILVSTQKPKVLEFPHHFPHTLLLIQNPVIIDSLSLMPLKWDKGPSKSTFVRYERNGFLEPLDLVSEEEADDTWGSSRESSECSVTSSTASEEETAQSFTPIPEEWSSLPNINLNSILVMDKERNLEGLLADGKPGETEKDDESVAESSELGDSDEEENCEKQLQHFSGYVRR
ncbi:uncharacterized protein LOC108698278 [Xenopus laevis]|uniref:Uncharacterized protein LOC108698278 n=2 Tax=Xenopus laevis TaxID=8355 RepID=A0A1L8F6Q2_XENLA|nr:uncharacterized protein LOC108698278 [Xenopus laevis]OCT67263.1 hypothetical protein XELAEV_18038547mg [Xenopus laevis]